MSCSLRSAGRTLRAAARGPGDIKKRQNAFGYGMPYPRVIPTATVQVSSMWWDETCRRTSSVDASGAAARSPIVRSGRPPSSPSSQLAQAVPSLDHVSLDQGACLGIPASRRIAGPRVSGYHSRRSPHNRGSARLAAFASAPDQHAVGEHGLTELQPMRCARRRCASSARTTPRHARRRRTYRGRSRHTFGFLRWCSTARTMTTSSDRRK